MQPGGHVVGRCHTGAAVLVSQQFFGGEPVIKFAACGLAFFQPESMGGVLNFGLSWLDLRRRAGAGAVMFGGRFHVGNPSGLYGHVLRTGWR